MATQLSVTEQNRATDDTATAVPDTGGCKKLKNFGPTGARISLRIYSHQYELLGMVGDEYTRRVLAAVTEQPRSGSEIVEAADVSKATAYRRLDDLEDAGLVDSEMVFDPEGHHHEQFHAVVESIDISVGSDGVS